MANMRRSRVHGFASILCGGAALCAIFIYPSSFAVAQTVPPGDFSVPEGTKMLLAADELIYNNDTGIVVHPAACRSTMAITSWSPTGSNMTRTLEPNS